MTGLSVSIFKDSDYNGDCTNKGFSSQRTRAFVFSDEVSLRGNYTPNEITDTDYLVITKGPYNSLRAVPKSLIENKAQVMFGGNFVYTSDSRFSELNNGNPIKIFDRVE